MKIRFSIATVALLASVEAFGQGRYPAVDRVKISLPIEASGTLWINNGFGSIDVVGGDSPAVEIVADRSIVASDQDALTQAKDAVAVEDEGDTKVRLVRVVYPTVRSSRWVAKVALTARVPRGINVKIAANAMDHIRLTNITGSVTVVTFSGTVILANVTGPSTVEATNGHVIYDYQDRPTANVQVQAINANIDIYAPASSAFLWVADTIKGDFLTTFKVQGSFLGSVYRGMVSRGGPTIKTSTFTGNVTVLAKGTSPAQAHSVRLQEVMPPPRSVISPEDLALRPARKIQLPIVKGDWYLSASVADITIGELRGSARVETGAGEVHLDVVYGTCLIRSNGGPITLGDMMGAVIAHTGAGDVVLNLLRQGGAISTDGGAIRLQYAGAPTTLRSAGGDITVRQASAPVSAETRSGDISITADPGQTTQRISAKTAQGNVMLSLHPRFGADIDATVLTDDADANAIHSDFNLTVRREAFNGRTRVHATGKINGGGEKVELFADDGSINISSKVLTPLNIAPPRP